MDASVLTELAQGKGAQYIQGVGAVALLYDIVITFPDEVRLIWPAPRSITKYLYFVNRYTVAIAMIYDAWVMSGFASPMTDQVCWRYYFAIEMWDCLEGMGIIGALVLFRVYALYKTTKYITALLILLWAIYLFPATSITIWGFVTFYNQPGTLTYTPYLDTCALSGRPNDVYALWIPMLFFETVVFGMVMYKVYQHTRMIQTPIMSVLFRDGLLYYGVMLTGEAVNLVAFVVFPDPLYFSLVHPNWCLASIIISRIYLNLRDVANAREWSTATALDHPAWEQVKVKPGSKPTLPGVGSKRSDGSGLSSGSGQSPRQGQWTMSRTIDIGTEDELEMEGVKLPAHGYEQA
ncbi:hypothetical protein CALCODRAFT_92785 [Calocera cornea HHB12733]|uniref:DUF6533 domain-containing protein n=1 Tax=Calocera cornea HHB12733 TaxID=1353952 RepID=A0A165D911_9BASI|nr:hypothetical protein CALCODRAFT_92785 [Calocera cornea HHB12733]